MRALVILKVVAQPGDLIDMGETELQEVRTLAEPASLEDLQRLLAILIRTEADLAVSNYPRLTMEMVLVKLAGLPAGIDVSTLLQRLDRLETKLAAGLPVPSEKTPVRGSAPPVDEIPPPPAPDGEKSAVSLPIESGDKSWEGLVGFVANRRKPRISSLLEQSSLLLLQLPQLKIGMPGRFYNLADSDMRQAIQTLAIEYFGVDVKVVFEKVGNGDKAPLSLHEERTLRESDRQKKLRENAVEHPLVKSALDIFGGKIEEVKPIDKGFV